MLCYCWSSADATDVMPNLRGQVVYMMGIPRIMLVSAAAGFWGGCGLHLRAASKLRTGEHGPSF